MAKLHHAHAGLLIVRGSEQTMIPLTKDVTTIGRKFADILIDDSKVSSSHAEIRKDGDRYILKDLGSTNGSFVNRKIISTIVLTDQDVIEFGSTTACFYQDVKSFPTSKQPSEDTRSESISTKARDVITTTKTMQQSSLRIEITEGPDKGKKFNFKKPYVMIGRKDADLTLMDVDVSRSHALIEIFSKNSVFVKDLESTNGTFVNGKKIISEKVTEGDEITVGNTTIKVHLVEVD